MTHETVKSRSGTTNTIDNVKMLIITAVCIAMTYVFTAFVNVQLPVFANGGLIHLGNVPLFLAAILFGKKTGALAGGIGMVLFDLMAGWTIWAPFTLLISGFMGYLVGSMTYKHGGTAWNALAISLACIIRVAGYYVAEGIIYGNWAAPMISVPGNIIQVVVAAILVIPVSARLKKVVNTILV